MKPPTQTESLQQQEFLEHARTSLGTDPWVTLYERVETDQGVLGRFCALIAEDRVERALNNDSWDLAIDDVRPGCSVRHEKDGREVTTYHRWGGLDGVEPFVLRRYYDGLRPAHSEVIEEFRLFHNLFFDAQKNAYVRFDDSGDEVEVVRVSDGAVKARLLELRQFLAFKGMFLALFFERDSYLSQPLSAEQLASLKLTTREGPMRFQRHGWNNEMTSNPKRKAGSRVIGKKLIAPMPREQTGIWPYDRESQEYADFAITTDSDGRPVLHTCNPEALANDFGKNPDAPHFLTPVFFRREVLQKYFGNPGRYRVEDGYLRCSGLWGLRMDNDHDRYVVVFLGYLGESLPHAEQLYWKSFNVPPDGTLSEVARRRSFDGEFADPTRPDLVFKSAFARFAEAWERSQGWPLFKALGAGDVHLLDALHIPVANEQAEFDSQVLALTKTLIDSLNEAEIQKRVPALEPNDKGISKFEKFLDAQGMPEAKAHVGFLRNLQSLRSTGVGHRKGDNYQKVAASFGIGKRGLPDVFAAILTSATALLSALEGHFLKGTTGAASTEPAQAPPAP